VGQLPTSRAGSQTAESTQAKLNECLGDLALVELCPGVRLTNIAYRPESRQESSTLEALLLLREQLASFSEVHFRLRHA